MINVSLAKVCRLFADRQYYNVVKADERERQHIFRKQREQNVVSYTTQTTPIQHSY